MTTVLVVDDEPQLRRALAMNLTARGYEVHTAGDGTSALTLAASQPFDIIVLDLGLPDLDGLDVIRAIRKESGTPIVVLSARQGSPDKVQALDLGANDYVTKPFDMNELLARLRAAARRISPETAEPISFGPVTVDLRAKTVHRTNPAGEAERVHLTPTEWHLLELLLRHPGRLMTQSQLLIELRGQPDYTDSSYLRIYMAQLRRKLEDEPSRPQHLLTEPGMGYRFQP